MNGTRLSVLLVSLLLVTGIAFAAERRPPPTRTMHVAIGEWPPFVSENLEHYGLAARIVTEAFDAVGNDVKYRFYPWKRAYLETTQGDQDATAIWTKTPRREGEVLFSEPVLVANKVFFHLESTEFDWNSIGDLEGYTVGATRGYGYGDAFDKAVEEGRIDVEYVDSDLQNFRKLVLGRIDLFPMTKAVGYSILNTEFSAEERATVTSHERPVQQAVFHLLFSKSVERNPAMVDRFNRGLAQLRKEGRIAQYVRESEQGKYIRSE